MESRPEDDHVRIAPNGVKITTPPYLDPRVNPDELDFDPRAPQLSRVMSGYLRKYGNATFAITSQLDQRPQKTTFVIYQVLGEGTFGRVYLAQNKATGEWVAIKKATGNPTNTDFLAEVRGMRIAQTLVGFDLAESVIVMSLLPGFGLKHAVVNHRDREEMPAPQHVSLLQRMMIAKDVLKRAAGMHKDVELIKDPQARKKAMHMLHRDIKPENMVLDTGNNTVTFCDYGMAAEMMPDGDLDPAATKHQAKTSGKVVADQLMGTEAYLAPELLHFGEKTYNEATEVYALGMALADVMGLTRRSLIGRFAPGIGSIGCFYLSPFRGDVPKELVRLLKEMTHKNPDRRPGVIVAAQRLNKIVSAQAKKTGLKVCTLSIRAFLNADEKRRKKFISDIIKGKINTVALTALERDDVTLREYYLVRHQLMQAGIIHVSPFMTTGLTQQDNIRVVKDYYDAGYGTTHTKVFQYQSGKLIDKTPPASVLKLETPGFAAVRDQVRARDKIFAEMNYVIEHAKHIRGFKKSDLEVLRDLPPLLTAEDFVPFMRALETAYLQSLKAAKSLFGSKVTEEMINNAAVNKYVLPRTLGLMLKEVYKYVDKLSTNPDDVMRRAPKVYEIDSHIKRHQKKQAAGAKVKYQHI